MITASGILTFPYPITGTNFGIGHYNYPYFDNWRVEIDEAPLMADSYELSYLGGVVNLYIDAGSSHAGRNYFVLGSVSGTTPGTALPTGETLPLNWDLFTDITLAYANTPLFADFTGTLDVDGKAQAQLNSSSPLPRDTIGTVINFAYLLYYPMDYVSNSMNVEIVE